MGKKTALAPVRKGSTDLLGEANVPGEESEMSAQFMGFMPRAADPIAETLKRTKGKTRVRISIKAGQQFEGVFMGKGDMVPMEDPADPSKVRDVLTWNFCAPGAPNLRMQVVGWTTLDTELSSGNYGEGQTLTIIRGDKRQSRKGRMFSECLIIEHE
jgi:hypothetical protein